jgi:hypothetical protein
MNSTIPMNQSPLWQAETDERRGQGVHQRLRQKMAELKVAGMFFSLSFTMTRANFDTVTDPAFLAEAVAEWGRLFIHLEYTSICEGTGDSVITDEQRVAMNEGPLPLSRAP